MGRPQHSRYMRRSRSAVVSSDGLRWRLLLTLLFFCVVLSLVCAAIFGYVIPIADYRFNNTFIGAAHLPPGAIAVLLFILLLLNPILRAFSRRAMLTRNGSTTEAGFDVASKPPGLERSPPLKGL